MDLFSLYFCFPNENLAEELAPLSFQKLCLLMHVNKMKFEERVLQCMTHMT